MRCSQVCEMDKAAKLEYMTVIDEREAQYVHTLSNLAKGITFDFLSLVMNIKNYRTR